MRISEVTTMEQRPEIFPQMLYKHLGSGEGSSRHDIFFFLSLIQVQTPSQLNLISKKFRKIWQYFWHQSCIGNFILAMQEFI